MSYHGETDKILDENGGDGPPCPHCREPMTPVDDHGRFGCICRGIGGLLSPTDLRPLDD